MKQVAPPELFLLRCRPLRLAARDFLREYFPCKRRSCLSVRLGFPLSFYPARVQHVVMDVLGMLGVLGRLMPCCMLAKSDMYWETSTV